MSKVVDRLKQLYELAKIRPEEEGDEGRMNEARTAAFLLIKTARENGVRLKFEVVRETVAAKPTDPGTHPRPSAPRGMDREDWEKFWENLQNFSQRSPWQANVPSEDDARAWPSYGQQRADDDENLRRRVQEEAERAKRARQQGQGSPFPGASPGATRPRRSPGEVIDQQPSHPYAGSSAYPGVKPNYAVPEDYTTDGRDGWGPSKNRRPPPMCPHGTNEEACPICFQEKKGRPAGVRAKSTAGWDAAVDGVQFLKAKFSGVCAACGRSVAEGEMVWWKPGVGVTHGGCGNDVLRGVKEKTG